MKLNGSCVPFVLSSCLAVVACTTPVLEAQWSDPQFQGTSLRGARVFVVCESAEVPLKRLCKDHVAYQLSQAGAVPVQGPDLPVHVENPPAPEDLLAAAQTAGARVVLMTWIMPNAAVANPPPSFSFGIGGFGFGGGGGGGGAAVGATLPVGAGNVVTGYTAEARLTDAAQGKLLWTGKASAPPSSDLNRQLADLAGSVVRAAVQAAH